MVFDKARYWSPQRAGATACLRARPTESLLVIPAVEFAGIGRCFVGIEGHVAVMCPCCDAVDSDSRLARICPRAEEQFDSHQPLLHAMCCMLKWLPATRASVPEQKSK